MPKRRYKKDDFNVGKTLPVGQTFHGMPNSLTTDAVSVDRPAGWKRFIVSVLLITFVFFLIIASWNALNISRASQKVFGSGNLLEMISSSGLEKDEHGRVNVLIVGYSVDDPGHPGARLTDSIMILSMDPENSSGYMLSIPRDLYVRYPNGSYNKINEAYQDGGMPLLEQIVSDKLAIDVGYHVIVNYSAVRETVNAIEGIDVKIESPDKRGLFDPNISPVDGGPLRLTNGWHHLDGQTALNLTRARGAAGGYGFPQSDFNRTQNQKLVFLAIKQKATSWKMILNPQKNSKLFAAVGDNVRSDLELSEVLPLYRLFSSIPNQELKSVALNNIDGKNLLRGSQGGLVPAAGQNDYSDIRDAIRDLD